MVSRYGLFLLCILLLIASAVSAQSMVLCLNSVDYALTNSCAPGGTPLPDGTPVWIYYDANENGPDQSDSLVQVCAEPPDCPSGPTGTYNFDHFLLNGAAQGTGAGTFANNPCFVCVGFTPSPARYWLRISLPNLNWTSTVITAYGGLQEVWLSASDWSCVIAGPPGAAGNPLPLHESTGVPLASQLTWSAGGNTQAHDVYFGTVNPPPFAATVASSVFTPPSLQAGTRYYWQIVERNSSGSTPGPVWQFTTQCPVADSPSAHAFATALDSCWFWLRDDPTHHSLSARPGYLRIVTQGGEVGTDAPNVLLRPRLHDAFTLETHLTFSPTTNYQQAGLMIWLDSTRHVVLHRYVSGGQKLMFRGDRSPGGYDYSTYIANTDTSLYLRLSVDGTLVTAFYSLNGSTWYGIASHVFAWMNDSVQAGIYACNGGGTGYAAPQIAADFDYANIQFNCPRNVSGTWTRLGSPYRIYCTMVVPYGQTLTIEPGTQVRFMWDAQLQVLGTLTAEGTADDSITFWADTVQNPARWGGIRIAHTATESRFRYCKFVNGLADGSGDEGTAGALFVDSSRVTVRHCLFSNNSALTVGALAMRRALSGSLIDSCSFIGNSAQGSGTAGAVRISYNPVNINRCLFAHNRASSGGALEVLQTACALTHCTMADNIATAAGTIALAGSNGHLLFNSSILSPLGSVPLFSLGSGASALLNYCAVSDLGAGFSNLPPPAGFGVYVQTNASGDSVDIYHNLLGDPRFAETARYGLAWDSRCFDAGDPAFALDADGTANDQGYLAYDQPTLTVDPAGLDFEQVLCGDTAVQTVTLINPTSTPAHLNSASNSEPLFSLAAPLPEWVPANSSVPLAVRAVPVTEGAFADTLIIASRLSGADWVAVPLTAGVPYVPVDAESLVVKPAAANSVELYWAAVTHTTSGRSITPVYHIYGSNTPGGPYSLLDISADNHYLHSGVVGTLPTYFYRVTAYYDPPALRSRR